MRLAAAISTVLSLTWLTLASALADPVGRYNVEGTNPGGGSSYSGTVAVEKTGRTYRVTWNVGGSRYIGTGIGDAKFIAVSYRSAGDTGLALYAPDSSGGWVGIWTYADGQEVDNERWTRR